MYPMRNHDIWIYVRCANSDPRIAFDRLYDLIDEAAGHALERFEGEILKCLDGTSNFTEDMIAKQIRRYQQELDDAKAEYAALQNARLNEAA